MKRIGILGLVLACSAWAGVSGNLLVDGDAEDSDRQSAWKSSDSLQTLLYGEFGGGPAADSPGPPQRGQRYFYARLSSSHPLARFTQQIDLKKPLAHSQAFHMGGWFGGVNTSFSSSRLGVEFVDGKGVVLGRAVTDEVTVAERADDLVLIERKQAGEAPAGTRSIRVNLEMYLFEGHAGDNIDTLAYADQLYFQLGTNP